MGGAVRDGWLLAQALRRPGEVLALDAEGWTTLIAIARAEQMIGTLAHRLDGLAVPNAVARLLADGAELDQRDARGYSPLMLAAFTRSRATTSRSGAAASARSSFSRKPSN